MIARWRGELTALALGLAAAAFAMHADHVPYTASSAHPARARAPATSSRSGAAQPDVVPPRRGSLGTDGAPGDHLPASLVGTEPDGDLHVGAGRFIPTPGALRVFDYYLTTLGEGGVPDLGAVRALVAAEARRRLPDDVGAVVALFDRYVAYLADLRDALALRPDLPLADAHAVTLARQRAWFGDEAAALFAEDNALAARLVAAW